MLIGGSSITFWAWRFLWENCQFIVESYSSQIIIYLAVTATISFGVCYYKGPVSNPRTLNLLQWAIQVSVRKLMSACSHYD